MVIKPKKILVTSIGVNDGLPNQRLHLPLRHFKDKYDFIFRDIQDVSHTDLMYSDLAIQCHPWIQQSLDLAEKCKFHYRIPCISDIDDLILNVPTDHPSFAPFKGNRMTHIIQASSFVVYSTPWLEQKLRHLNTKTKVIENSIDEKLLDAYRPRNKPHKTCFTIFWSGGQTHRSDILYTFSEDLERFLLNHPDTRMHFHVLCVDRIVQRCGAQVSFDPHPVPFMDFPAMMSAVSADVALVGLEPNEFNEGKSDMKLLETAPHGIPLIASPRSDFWKHKHQNFMLYAERDSVEHASWYEALVYAYNNQAELKAMGEKAKAYVLNERTSAIAAAKWEEVLKCFL